MSHLFIAGTGRAGTTALVELFAACGMDTGSDELAYFSAANAGFESYPTTGGSRRVWKSPLISVGLDTLIERGFDPATIEAVILPVRRNEDVAASRIDNFSRHGLNAKGGLWTNVYGSLTVITRPSNQRTVLAEAVCELLLTTAHHQIPVVTLAYPRFVVDADYAWERLRSVMNDVDHERFTAAHRGTMRTELVHEYPEYSRTRLRLLDLRWRLQLTRASFIARLRGTGRVLGD